MIELLAKLFIKNRDNTKDPGVRSAWGLLCSIVTIALNVVLFAAKYFAGLLAGSVSIMADSFNNLSDAGSAVLILFGFKFAGIKPTVDRPFGHGRIEYIVGLAVSVLILIVGFQSLKDAIGSIIHPEDVAFSWLTAAILLVSIAAKFYMAFYGRKIAKKIDSTSLKVSADENMTDTISTALALLSLFLNRFAGLKLDGYMAVIVSGLLIKAGIESGWETLQQLLGKKADPELVSEVERIAMSYDEIIGIHDMIIHDYGPGRLYISLHCEVPGNGDVYELHDAMDRCMKELDEILGCESVIHMDPINTDDGYTMPLREKVSALIKENIGEEITIHDFRVVPGPTHTNIIFDAVIPQRFKMSDEEAAARMKELVSSSFDTPTFAVIKVEKPYA